MTEFYRWRVRPGSSGAAQWLDAEITHDVDQAVVCGGSSTTARVRRAEHRIRGGSRRPCCPDGIYVDAALAITAELKDDFQHSFTQGEFGISAIVDMANAEN